LQDSTKTSVPSGDGSVKQATGDQKVINPTSVSGYWIMGALGLIGLIAIVILRRSRHVNERNG
jgi:hypothetical protein